jgi:tetrahydromethanopterin S-methyltransferase subunit F
MNSDVWLGLIMGLVFALVFFTVTLHGASWIDRAPR